MGSEMCIRDSFFLGGEGVLGGTGVFLWRSEEVFFSIAERTSSGVSGRRHFKEVDGVAV